MFSFFRRKKATPEAATPETAPAAAPADAELPELPLDDLEAQALAAAPEEGPHPAPSVAIETEAAGAQWARAGAQKYGSIGRQT